VLRIAYEAEAFPNRFSTNGIGELAVTWDDVLWAAVTVGRPNRQYVFRHGNASMYEAVFRWSLVRMALEQSGPHASRLRRTSAAKTLDPSEKGAINYFVGMTFCKLFAAKLLDTPWLLHLDVFRPELNPVLAGRSRPDLVGQEHATTRWHAFECKGRISLPDASTKSKAKAQAQRLVCVNGTPCTLHIGAVTYLQRDTLHFYWRDPQPEDRRGIEVPFRAEDWMYYYMPLTEVVGRVGSLATFDDHGALLQVEGADVRVGIHPAVAKHLNDQRWNDARQAAIDSRESIVGDGFQPDGLKVVAGESWTRRFVESAIDAQ
jgi:hypothetical protein